jgi:HEAT repeat protein
MAGKKSMVRGVESRLKELRKQFASGDRLETVRRLGEGSDPADEILLLYLLDHQSEWVREEAVDALEKRRGLLARIGVRAALGDPKYNVRNAAAEALGMIGSRRDVPWLLHTLQDPEWIVRCSAAEALGYLGGPRARRALLKALTEDPEPAVRMWVAGGIGSLQDESVVADLEQALEREDNPWVLSALVRALYRLGQRPLAVYLGCLQHDDFLIRDQTLSGIPWEVRPEDREQVIAAVRQLLEREEHRGVRGDAEAALRRMHKAGSTGAS